METSRGRRRPPPGAKSFRTRRPSTATSSRPYLPSVMLDRFVHLTKGHGDEVVRYEVADGTLSEISATCTGKPIAVSLRVAEPPAVSRLYLHWPEGSRIKSSNLAEPSIIAAHGESILFKTFVPLLDDYVYYPIDYFVYTASCSGKSPSLTLLPPCFIGGVVDPDLDQFFKPYHFQRQRRMMGADVGLLCRGVKKFTVAEFRDSGELCVLHHTPGERNMKWELKKLRMPYGVGTPNLLCGSWQTDTVVPFGDSCLCWVDYYLGLLFVDVVSKHKRPPRYHPLPPNLDSRRLYIDPGASDPARRVCVTDTGMIKLVCISDHAGRSLLYNSHSAFIIRIWTLINSKEMHWVQDTHMEASEFWAALRLDRRLPLVLPMLPILSMVDPNVICFQLNDSSHNFWLIEVDMKKPMLGAVTLYFDEEEGCSADVMARRNVFDAHSFIPSQFTRYLNKHAITSLRLSEKLQKTKLERAMEKRQIEDPIQGLLRQIQKSC